jgi:hypothetical protein
MDVPSPPGSGPNVTGYLSPQYADSLSEFGVPRRLPQSGGWVLERPIPESQYRDAVGCYPLFCCTGWGGLQSDVASLSDDLVSLCLVADPFGEYHVEDLRRIFDLVLPFKQHLVADLSRAAPSFVSAHHRREVSQALRQVEVERCERPLSFLDEWVALYTFLRARHSITGISAFSAHAFEKQLAAPGLVMFRAWSQSRTVGIHLWYVQRDVAYFHLAAANAEGYRLGASYALLWQALASLPDEVRWLDLGSAPDRSSRATAALQQWKAGWSTGTRAAFLCGKVLQPATYRRLVEASRIAPTGYFPAYRAPSAAAAAGPILEPNHG